MWRRRLWSRLGRRGGLGLRLVLLWGLVPWQENNEGGADVRGKVVQKEERPKARHMIRSPTMVEWRACRG